MNRYLWNGSVFDDWRWSDGKAMRHITAAAYYPLFFGVATAAQAAQTDKTVTPALLKSGGIVTTTTVTGQQWDAPNGWAPLEWMTIAGLTRYGQTELAAEIARRWIAVNTRVYRATGRMMEKYDVEDLSKPSGGGEYPTQDGFGWTNGVLLKLLHEFPTAKPR